MTEYRFSFDPETTKHLLMTSGSYTIIGKPWQENASTTGFPGFVCPDLLRYEQIGAADNLRGRVVRAFFWILRAWPVTDFSSRRDT